MEEGRHRSKWAWVAKAAAGFATLLLVSYGLCAYSVNGHFNLITGLLGLAGIIIGALGIFGTIIAAISTFFESEPQEKP